MNASQKILGVFIIKVAIAVFSFICISVGYYLINHQRLAESKLLSSIDAHPKMQFLGYIFVFVGTLPWTQFFMLRFLFNTVHSLYKTALQYK
jgi:hypothetical protein